MFAEVNGMKKLFVVTALLLSFALLAQAISSQTEEIGVSASEVPKLISVSASLSFENLVPAHLYSTPIRIDWAVPESALSNLAESEVIVRVKIEPRTSNSWIYFEKEGVRYKTAYTELRCLVENGKCNSRSALSQTITANYIAPLGAQYPHDDGLKVSAFLIPIEQLQQEYALELNASAQISSLASIATRTFDQAAGSPASQQVNELIEQARSLLAEKKFDELKLQIALLEERIAELQKTRQTAVTARQKANELDNNALQLEDNAPTFENEQVGQENGTQSNESGIGLQARGGSSQSTGFVVNSSTAAAAGAVGLLMAALLGYAATRRKGARLTPVRSDFAELGGKPSMGSGQSSIAAGRGVLAPIAQKE